MHILYQEYIHGLDIKDKLRPIAFNITIFVAPNGMT